MEKILLCALLGVAAVLSADQELCAAPGVNPNPRDRSSFVICSEVGNSTSVTKVVQCPNNYMFSPEERTCVEEHNNPHHRTSRATSSICNTTGPVCASCDLMLVCAEMARKFTVLANVSCSETDPENICDAKTNSCRRPTNDSSCRPSTASVSFRCLQPGFFPDPSDCKKYHICDDSLVHYEDSCDVSYDPKLATCQDNITCTNSNPIPDCASDPISREIVSSPEFYRICIPSIVRSPQGVRTIKYEAAVLQCPPNKQYNSITSSCELFCKKRPDQMPDPEDCHSYYECPANKENTPPVKKTCQANLAYDSVKRMCSLESRVASCRTHSITTRDVTDSQVSTPNSTSEVPQTTSSSTTPSTAATTATPKPTVTIASTRSSTPLQTTLITTQATTTKPQTLQTSQAPQRCSENSKFEDSTNCYRYYHCISGRLQRRQCPFLFSFSPYSNECVLTFFCFNRLN